MKAEEFGKYIRELRKQRNLTIRQLELYSGVSNSYLSQLENGKRGIPSAEILKKLSGPLNITQNELMIAAGYIDEDEEKDLDYYKKKISKEFPDIDLMFKDLNSLTAEDLREVYEYIKFKMSQKKDK